MQRNEQAAVGECATNECAASGVRSKRVAMCGCNEHRRMCRGRVVVEVRDVAMSAIMSRWRADEQVSRCVCVCLCVREQAGFTIEVLDVATGAAGDQPVGEGQVEEGVGEVQGGLAAPVLGVDVGAVLEEEVDDGRLPALRRKPERRVSVHEGQGCRTFSRSSNTLAVRCLFGPHHSF